MKEVKVRLIIIILIILIVIVSIGGTCLYLFTDALKSDEVLFKKYAFQSIENIAYVIDISSEENSIDELRTKDYTETTDLSLNYIENASDEEEVYDIKETGSVKNSEESSYRNIEVSYDDTEIISIDLKREDEIYGLRFANVVQQFVSIENESLSYFISSIGYDGSYFSETLQQVDISDIFTLSEDEIESLITSYSNAIFVENMEGASFSSKSGVIITLNNGESVTTKSYTLTLTQNELDKIYTRVANQALEDEIILSKLEAFDNKVKEIGINVEEGDTLKERYTEYFQEIIDSIDYEGTDLTETEVTVYVADGMNVRTSIKREEYEYNLDLDNTDGITMSLKTIILTNEGTDETTISLGKSDTENGTKREFSYEDMQKEITANITYQDIGTGINSTLNLEYSSENIAGITLNSTYMLTYSDDIEIEEEYTENNNIILNSYDGDYALSILDQLRERTTNSLEDTQLEINTKLLNNILLYLDEREEEKEEEEQSNLDAQKNKFNNKFTIYEGDEIEYEYVLKLLETVGQNMSDYEVVSGTRIKIYIEEGTENEEKADEIANAINDKNTYKIELNYSEDGYVESIDLSINTNN